MTYLQIAKLNCLSPVRLEQSGASLTANQEGVAGSSPVPATSFHWDLVMKKFYDHSHPSANSRRAVVSYWRNNGHEVLVNCLLVGGLPRNSVAKLPDRARKGRKTPTQQQHCLSFHRSSSFNGVDGPSTFQSTTSRHCYERNRFWRESSGFFRRLN